MKVWRLSRARWEVLLLADDQGRCQVLDTLAELENQGGRGMLALLRTQVPEHGPPSGNPSLCAPLEEGIFEFRKDAVRLFWFYDKGRVVVGAYAYKKQGQKAPRRHIETTKDLRKRYLDAKASANLEIEDLTSGEGT